jgi:hypothetical protein
MRISSVQPQLFNQQNSFKKVSSKCNTPIEQPKGQVSFRGGKGLVGGFLVGIFGTTAAIVATGGLAIPAILATYGAMGVGVGTAYIGDKVEDKLTGEDKK